MAKRNLYRETRVKTLFNEDLDDASIAERLGLTRRGVKGIRLRLGLLRAPRKEEEPEEFERPSDEKMEYYKRGGRD